MEADTTELMIAVDDLRTGMFVHLDLSWVEHPFPLNRFKIANQEQIHQIAGLGLKKVKVLPGRSDASAFLPASQPPASAKAAAEPPASAKAAAEPGASAKAAAEPPASAKAAAEPPASAKAAAEPGVSTPPAPARTPESAPNPLKAERRQLLDQQAASLARCERLFGECSTAWKQIMTASQREPVAALEGAVALVGGFLDEMSTGQETSIRLLSETAGDGGALHALNVTVVSLLLGRAMKLDAPVLSDIGLGALLHDIGKQALPDRLRWRSDQFSAVEERGFREHVAMGVQMAARMGLPTGVQQVIAQHHETVDGKGYPNALAGEQLPMASRIVALVNTYDNLCNPGITAGALTPHEALSLMFAQQKARFDPVCLTAFIRLMGVYPPGSVVQLSDERFAMVVSVNTVRPLKPTVLVFDPAVPREDALLLDLQTDTALGIRRSLHARNLSRPALDYLLPRKRLNYFFERGHEILEVSVSTAWVMDGSGKGGAGDAAGDGTKANA
jgi:putative nucleotidyltransferase with HDIG domain